MHKNYLISVRNSWISLILMLISLWYRSIQRYTALKIAHNCLYVWRMIMMLEWKRKLRVWIECYNFWIKLRNCIWLFWWVRKWGKLKSFKNRKIKRINKKIYSLLVEVIFWISLWKKQVLIFLKILQALSHRRRNSGLRNRKFLLSQ